MAESSNQSGTGSTPAHPTEAGGIAAQQSGSFFKGHVVAIPFTVKELLDYYETLPSADAREGFWKMLSVQVAKFDDEQKALFSQSWEQSMAETITHSDETIARIDAWIAQQKISTAE